MDEIQNDFRNEAKAIIRDLKTRYAPGHVLCVLDMAKVMTEEELSLPLMELLERNSVPLGMCPDLLGKMQRGAMNAFRYHEQQAQIQQMQQQAATPKLYVADYSRKQ